MMPRILHNAILVTALIGLAGCAQSHFQGYRHHGHVRHTTHTGWPHLAGITGYPYTGPYLELDGSGRAISLVMYDQGEPVHAWTMQQDRWRQTVRDGVGEAHRIVPNTGERFTELFQDGQSVRGPY